MIIPTFISKKAANNNYPMAYYYLGLMGYFEDGDIEYNLTDTINYFNKALSLNIKESKFFLASSYYWDSQYAKAINLFYELETNLKDPDRYWILKELSLSHYTLDNYKEALKYLNKIINEDLLEEQDDTEYVKILFRNAYSALMLEKNDNAEENFRKVINKFENENTIDELSYHLYHLSYVNLAQIFENKKDYREAVNLYEKAIEIDPTGTAAYSNLAYLYATGKGVEQDFKKSNEILFKASDLELSSIVNNNIGTSYENGEGVEHDFVKAREYYLKSTKEKSSIIGFKNLGYLYENGYGVEVDYNKAIEIYLEGVDIYNNRYVNENYLESYLEDSIYEDLLESIERLSNLNEQETFVKKENTKFNDELISCENLIEYVSAGYDQKENFEKCLKLAKKGDVDAQYYIGVFYNDGYVVDTNYSKAAEWYKKSLLQGDVYSKHYYSLLIINGYIKEEEINLINLLDEIIKDENDVFKIQALYNKGIVYKYGLYTEKDLDEALLVFNNIQKLIDYDKTFIDKAIDQADQIKAIKAGFAVENLILDIFPVELEGDFIWEDSPGKIKWNKVTLNEINQIGPDRFKIEGFYVGHDEEEIVYVNLNATVNTNLNSIEIWESNPISSDPDFDPEFDWITTGSYVGFYRDKFSEINAFWIPEKTGPRGTLNLINKNVFRGKENTQVELRKELNFGDYYVVVIGNNNYENLDSLKTARIDATTVAQVLKNKYDFNVLKTLTDATEKDIISTLYAINKDLNSYDNLLIYYAGHGYLDEDTNRGYWLPVDANTY